MPRSSRSETSFPVEDGSVKSGASEPALEPVASATMVPWLEEPIQNLIVWGGAQGEITCWLSIFLPLNPSFAPCQNSMSDSPYLQQR